MNILFKKCYKNFLFLALLSSCSPTIINDFFGIELNPEQEKDFQIVSYSAKDGVKYSSNPQMNPMVYAFAELQVNSVLIKIVNMDTIPIQLNYYIDEYILHSTKNETYKLLKGYQDKYSDIKSIGFNESIELDLKLPSIFWETIGMKNPQSHLEDYTEEFWTGENRTNFAKDEIKYIEVILGNKTVIILKPIP
jgi:hypothetical protein